MLTGYNSYIRSNNISNVYKLLDKENEYLLISSEGVYEVLPKESIRVGKRPVRPGSINTSKKINDIYENYKSYFDNLLNNHILPELAKFCESNLKYRPVVVLHPILEYGDIPGDRWVINYGVTCLKDKRVYTCPILLSKSDFIGNNRIPEGISFYFLTRL